MTSWIQASIHRQIMKSMKKYEKYETEIIQKYETEIS